MDLRERKALAAILLAASGRSAHAPGMFVVSEVEAAAIRAAFDRGGEFSAAIELLRLFPGLADNDQAPECDRTIAATVSISIRAAISPRVLVPAITSACC